MTGYREVVLADAPSAYWRLDEASGLILADSSGHGQTATISAAPGYGFNVVGAVNDGDTGLSLAAGVAITNFAGFAMGLSATYECWFRPDSTTAPPTYALMMSSSGGGFGLYYDRTSKKLLLYTGANERNGSVLVDGALYHVVVSLVAGAGTWYLNGVPDGTFVGWPGGVVNCLFNTTGGSADLKCSLFDEIALWNAIGLTGPQVLAHFNQGAAFNAGLVDSLDRLGPAITQASDS